MRVRVRTIAARALAVALMPSLVATAEVNALASEPPAIVGGSPSGPCEWPSVVALRTGGLCSGTLVHPRIVVYAAHCGTLHTHVLFGEDVLAPAREVPIARCERASDLFAVSSMDFAYCELAEPVEDVAVTPLLFGCDEALIEVGTPVTIVGFGDTTTEPPEQTGIKHAAQTQVVGYLSTVGIGGTGTGADAGDSGGPALVQLDDGSWRVLGVVSGGGGDGAAVQYVPAPKTVAWIEDRSGVDITPCHASDGSWAPTPACTGMFMAIDPDASWSEGCPGPVSPPSQRCGAPWTESADEEPPSVSFVEPLDGSELDGPPAQLVVLAEATDLGVGVREVRLLVDDIPWVDVHGLTAVDEVPPYRFEDLQLDLDGPHTLTLEAVDHNGNQASVSATVLVGDPPSETETETDGDGESGPALDGGDDAAGCSCALTSSPDPRHDPSRGPLALLLSACVLALRSRRRRRAACRRPR